MATVSKTVEKMPGMVPRGRAVITFDVPVDVGEVIGAIVGKITREHMLTAETGTMTVVDSDEMITYEFTGERPT